jgi:hypothetical protein
MACARSGGFVCAGDYLNGKGLCELGPACKTLADCPEQGDVCVNAACVTSYKFRTSNPDGRIGGAAGVYGGPGLDFGTVAVGATADRSLTIQNSTDQEAPTTGIGFATQGTQNKPWQTEDYLLKSITVTPLVGVPFTVPTPGAAWGNFPYGNSEKWNAYKTSEFALHPGDFIEVILTYRPRTENSVDTAGLSIQYLKAGNSAPLAYASTTISGTTVPPVAP